MKFDPIRNEVYTDNDVFVKKLYCPYKMNWDKLERSNSTNRKCSNCDNVIVDTMHLSDDDILKMVKQNPESCLKIDLNQSNMEVISIELSGKE